jgi:hypothetical protein
MTRDELVVALTDAFTARAEVVDVRLDGSLGTGGGDEHSDVDFVVLVDGDDDVRTVTAMVPEVVRSACDPVLIRTYPFVTTSVTREWIRFDVAVRSTSWPDFGPPDAATTAQQTVDEMFRCFGLEPVVIARGEWASAVVGTGLTIGLLLDLMQLENGTRRTGGALRLNDRLTAEQRAVIESLPPLHADRESLVALQRALLQDFLPRAKRLALHFGFEYPVELEEALLAHLARHGFVL